MRGKVSRVTPQPWCQVYKINQNKRAAVDSVVLEPILFVLQRVLHWLLVHNVLLTAHLYANIAKS